MSLISLWCCGFLNFEHIQHIYQSFCYSPWTCVYALGFSNVKGCHALTFKRSPKGFIVFWVMTKVKNICNGLFKFTTHTLTIFIVSVLYHIHNVLENLLQILVKPLGPMKEYLYLLENLAFFRFFFRFGHFFWVLFSILWGHYGYYGRYYKLHFRRKMPQVLLNK